MVWYCIVQHYVTSQCRSRERQLLSKIQATIDKGGKILIPVFALGRAQVWYGMVWYGMNFLFLYEYFTLYFPLCQSRFSVHQCAPFGSQTTHTV